MREPDSAEVVREWSKVPEILRHATKGLGEGDLDRLINSSGMSVRETIHHLAEANVVTASMIIAAAGKDGATFDWSWLYPNREWIDRMKYADLPIEPAMRLVEALNEQIANLVEVNPNALDHTVTVFDTPGGDTYQLTIAAMMKQEVDHAREHLGDMGLRNMEFTNASSEDLSLVFGLYDKAIEFQKTVFDKQWLGFDADLVNREIDEGRLWKIDEDGGVACIYSIAYEDPIIWGPTSHVASMYIHRIVTNPDFRGRGYVAKIVEWARKHAAENDLRYIRMDTWADNQKLKDYYIGCGFEWKGTVAPKDSPTMPAHYKGINLGLYEIDLAKGVPQELG